ncbi:MAG: hemerythrin domain-containing protein [Planctomycetota bacterium]
MSITRTRSTTVNAAFLRDIKDDNQELKRLFDHLGSLTFHPQMAINHWDELVATMDQLVDQVAMHFALEEAYGYFDNAIEVAVQLSKRSEMLRDQHATLFEKLVDLDRRISDLSPERPEKIAAWLKDFKHFNFEFARHEEAEIRLILSAIDDDLGVGD